MTTIPRFQLVLRHQPMSDTNPVRFVIRRYRGGEVRRRPWQGSGKGDLPPDGEWASLGPFWEYAYRATEEDTAEEDTAGGPPLDWAPDDEGWELVDLATIPRPVVNGTGLVAYLYADATRADLEKATPAELLMLLGLLWDQLCCRPGDDLVVPGFIDHLAALTVRGDQRLPDWLAPSEATDRLRRPLLGELHEIGVSLGLHSAALSERGWNEEDGALWLMSRWALKARRRWGEGYAPALDEYRQKWSAHLAGELSAAGLLRAWLDPEHEGPIPSLLVAWIARRVWGEVRAELEREREELERLRRWPSAILAAAYVPMVRSLVPATVEQGRVVDWRGLQLPLALSVPVDRVLSLEIMGRKVAQDVFRLLPDLARVAFNRAGAPVAYDPDAKCVVWSEQATGDALVEVAGGWSTLAGLLNMRGKDAPAEVREVIRLLAMVNLEWRGPGGSGGGSLLSWQDGTTDARRHHAPGRQSTVTLRISPPLAPGLTHQMPEQRRALVPVLRDPPPMIPGRPRLAAAVGRLDLLAVAELRNRAREAAERGGVVLNWDSLADRAELARRWVPEVLDVFVPERWERLPRGAWNLARVGAPGLARDFIEEAGRAEIAGARGGRHGAAKRQGRKRVKTRS